jgi:NAD(P)-dependent dehydrogenase (short-subunit alcohol dehydrogenase family)
VTARVGPCAEFETDRPGSRSAAGANWGAPLEEYPDEAFTKVLTLNLQRVFTLTQKLVPLLLASHPPGEPEDGPWSDPGEWQTVTPGSPLSA